MSPRFTDCGGVVSFSLGQVTIVVQKKPSTTIKIIFGTPSGFGFFIAKDEGSDTISNDILRRRGSSWEIEIKALSSCLEVVSA